MRTTIAGRDVAGRRTQPGWRRRVLVGLGVLAAGAGALAVAASAALAHVITAPRRLRAIAAREIDRTVEAVAFRLDDGPTLHGWYLRPPDPRDAIVIGHGFAMSRHELLDLAQGLRARGHAVLLFDFRAHGASEGDRSTFGYREADDLGAAVTFLAARPELAGRRLGVAGISMGAAAAILVAARDRRIAAVCADSAFATLRGVAVSGLRLFYRLPAIPFAPLTVRFGELLTGASIGATRPIDAIAALAPRPVLIVHNAEDWLIPVADAHALYAAAGGPKELWIVPDAGHAAAFLAAREEYVRRLDDFFTRALAAGAAGPATLGAAGGPRAGVATPPAAGAGETGGKAMIAPTGADDGAGLAVEMVTRALLALLPRALVRAVTAGFGDRATGSAAAGGAGGRAWRVSGGEIA